MDANRFDGTDATDVGLATSLALANELAVDPTGDAEATVRRILSIDPPSVEALHEGDIPAFIRLARRVEKIAVDVAEGDLDRAAHAVNEMLTEHSAHPHLAKQHGRWRLHHHPRDAEPLPMWTAIAADALARLIGSDHPHQLGQCSADDCARLYLDRSKNRSRRFCSTTCQNRVKAAAFRSRQRAAGDG
jgi:predicted RNA-binding Zn ribbon-like protein